MRFDGFDWDLGNWEKCQKHGATIEEIESLFSGAVRIVPDLEHSGVESRLRAAGLAATARWIFVAFTWRKRGDLTLIRPISARPMRGREIRIYEALSPPS